MCTCSMTLHLFIFDDLVVVLTSAVLERSRYGHLAVYSTKAISVEGEGSTLDPMLFTEAENSQSYLNFVADQLTP